MNHEVYLGTRHWVPLSPGAQDPFLREGLPPLNACRVDDGLELYRTGSVTTSSPLRIRPPAVSRLMDQFVPTYVGNTNALRSSQA